MSTQNTPVYQLLYRSKAKEGITAEDLVSILKASRKNNPKHNVSGILIYRQGYFLQILEGPEDKVVERYTIINKDPRHTDVKILAREKKFPRIFTDWSMGYLDDNSPNSGIKIETLNQLHDYAIKNAQPIDPKVIQSILNTFRNGTRSFAEELPSANP
jgi:hypothetical protein